MLWASEVWVAQYAPEVDERRSLPPDLRSLNLEPQTTLAMGAHAEKQLRIIDDVFSRPLRMHRNLLICLGVRPFGIIPKVAGADQTSNPGRSGIV